MPPQSLETTTLFQQLAISLLLGLLVGLQRERTEADLAGFRTFPLLTIFGTLCAVFGRELGNPWMVPAGFLGVIAVIIVGNLPRIKAASGDTGVTTEVAMFVMYVVGALVVVGPWSVAVAVAGGAAILLHLKPQMHGFAARLRDEDFRAVLQFVLITFIILPVLPNVNYDPLEVAQPLLRPWFPNAQFGQFDVLNPYQIWLMVVLVVGISFGGYVSYKVFGQRAGTALAGILGGTISSTATTVSYARRSKTAPAVSGLAAVVVMIASSVTYVRVMLEMSIAGPSFVRMAVQPVLVLLGVTAALSAIVWFIYRTEEAEMPVQGNPAELKPAILFALVYAVVLYAVAVGRAFLEDTGLYAIAFLSGMTDMDAITLSTCRLVESGRLQPEVGWRLIVVGSLSNLVFKAGIVALTGDRRMFRLIAVLFGICLAAGVAVLLLWPN